MPQHASFDRQAANAASRPMPGDAPVTTLEAAFQPIVDLQTGEVGGFEALARLSVDGKAVPPADYLPHLDERELLALFERMVGLGLAFLRTVPGLEARHYVSVNVEARLLLSPDFVDVLRHLLDRHGFTGGRLVLEVLEGENIDEIEATRAVLSTVRSLGVGIAIDDVGSAYASLSRIRDLPADIVKLDGGFTRNLRERPEDLAFIVGVAALARGLGKRLVVEGVEADDTLDALAILGIDLVQGYAVARPMPGRDVGAWLRTWAGSKRSRTPRSLLGAYASHLNVVEICRALANQPLQIEWKEAAGNWRSCEIGRFFTKACLHDTPCGQAHVRFHEVMASYGTRRDEWEVAAGRFRAELVAAMDEGRAECGATF